MKKRNGAVIVAAGNGRRMGAKGNKVFLPVCGVPILIHTLKVFAECGDVDTVVVVTRECDIELCKRLIAEYKITKVADVVSGGATRQQSVYIGVQNIGADCDVVAVHDGARALIAKEQITLTIEAARKYGAAAVGVKCKDTLKSADSDGFITGTIDREHTFNIQTPQTFKYKTLDAIHKNAIKNGIDATDDCALAEEMGIAVKIVEGSYDNIKITTPEDLEIAESILKRRKSK